MAKKQIAIKIVCIIILIGIITFFIVYFNLQKEENVPENKNETETESESEQEVSKPQSNYTTLPKLASNIGENKIINIGGINNEKIVNQFIIDNEIFVLLESNSDDHEMKATSQMLAVAKLDTNLTLNKVYMLNGSENSSYFDSKMFYKSIVVLVKLEEHAKLLLYDENFNLIKEQKLENINSCKLSIFNNKLKLFYTTNNSINFMLFDENLTTLNSYSKKENSYDIVNVFSYLNKDIVVTKNNDNFSIYKVDNNSESNQIYYVISKICTINLVLCDIIPNNKNLSELIFTTKKENKLTIITFNIKQDKCTNYDTNMAIDKAKLIQLDNGYILHNFIDNSLSVLDDSFNVILSSINKEKLSIKITNSYLLNNNKNYIFSADMISEDSTNIYSYNKDLTLNSIIKLPKISKKINIKMGENCYYLFITTNNNINEFASCYGGYDAFIIKVLINNN